MHATGTSTDLYQLTMAQGYWLQGWAQRRSVFHWTYRRAPFGGNGVLVCGIATLLEALEQWRFESEDLQYLASLQAADGTLLFQPRFLDWLGTVRWQGDIDAMPEGTWALPRTPLLRVTAPLVQAQLIETMLLTILNFQSLIATKAARVVQAAGDDEVLEFGLRRAQGLDGGHSASRAAFVGGCHATSNVEAGRRFGIPVRGTHAHSWVMTFDDEQDAFERYSQSLANNVVLLVDTYDTLQGIRNAIEVGLAMQARGDRLLGIRLDSGDLTQLSIQARHLLDQAGLEHVRIVASSDLDEYAIAKLKQQGAEIDIWGIGTRLVTAYDQPALGGVYKLGAIEDERGIMQPRLKRSDDPIKMSDPGAVTTSRVEIQGRWVADVVHAAHESVDLSDLEPALKSVTQSLESRELLVPWMRDGQRVSASQVTLQRDDVPQSWPAETLTEIRERARKQLGQIDVMRAPAPVVFEAADAGQGSASRSLASAVTAPHEPSPQVLWSGSLARLRRYLLSER